MIFDDLNWFFIQREMRIDCFDEWADTMAFIDDLPTKGDL